MILIKKYDNLRNKKKTVIINAKQDLFNLDTVAKESIRVSNIAKNAPTIINDIDAKFEKVTKLDKTDISFLFFATALQCARQYLLTDFKERLGEKESAKSSKKKEKKIYDRFFESDKEEQRREYHATLNDIILKGVPYDANWGSKNFDLGGEGKALDLGEEGKGLDGYNHRFRTLGHDPLLGWIFGTSNIMTSTLTDWKFKSYHVKIEPMGDKRPTHDGRPMYKVVKNADTGVMLNKVWERSIDEPIVLAAVVIKQALHLESDEFSKVGLPIPVISAISPEFAERLAKKGVDMGNLKIVGRQATVSILINTLIGMIHGLFYDESKYSSWDLYEVKTRKILSYSNIIASTSNMLYVAFSKDYAKFDIGGLLVTLYRIINDQKFMKDIKQEFLDKEFHNIVLGSEYDF